MKKILLDVDDVICQNGFLDLLNTYLNTNYEISHFKSYYIEEDVMGKEEIPKFYEYIKDKNCYTKAVLFEDAYETIKELNEKYDLYILSAVAIDIPGLKEASGMYFKHKYDYLIKELPFIDINKIIFTGTKNIFNADIQIDDKFSHLVNNNIPLKLLFTSYHNKTITNEELKKHNVIRVNNWKEIANILLHNN